MTFIAHPFLCTVCKKPRQNDANHWFLVFIVSRRNGPGILIEKWDPEVAREKNVEHACGQECMQTLVERWAIKGTLI